MRAPTYVWKSGSSFFFQYAIPVHLKEFFGRTPLRSRIPTSDPRQAAKIARHAAATIERLTMRHLQLMCGTASVNRKAVLEGVEQEIATLAKMLQEVERRHRDGSRGRTSVADPMRALQDKNDALTASFQAVCERMRTLAGQYDSDLSASQNRVATLTREKEEADIDAIHFASDAAILQKEADFHAAALASSSQTIDRYAARIANEDRLSARLDIMMERNDALITENQRINARLDDRGPLFSETFDAYQSHLIISSVSEKERKNLRRRCEIFIELVGDKPVASYDLHDLQSFAHKLTFLPERHSIMPGLKGMQVSEIITMAMEDASEIERRVLGRNEKRKKGSKVFITEKTILTGYIGRVKSALRYSCAAHGVQYPYEKFGTVRFCAQSASVIRHGLWAESVNTILAKSAEREKPEEAILPLLALLTGARIGELVYLEATDLVGSPGQYIFNLTNRDFANKRPLKTENARRFMVVHDKLVDMGFVDWVLSKKHHGGPLFEGFHRAKNPAGAASKRFQRLFDQWGLRDDRSEVFHALRHTYKDIARAAEIPERTIALQTGHSLEGVALSYGMKALRTDEIKRLASMPLPAEWDFVPWEGAFRRLQGRRRIKRRPLENNLPADLPLI